MEDVCAWMDFLIFIKIQETLNVNNVTILAIIVQEKKLINAILAFRILKI